MAAAVDKSETCLEFGRVPVIDMQYFSQDEINTAARSSNVYSFDDLVIPNSNYSTLNVSTGSINRTYLNQNLLQFREELVGHTRQRVGHLSGSRQHNTLTENKKKQVHWVLELIKGYQNRSVSSVTNLKTAFGGHNLAASQETSNLEAGNSLQLLTDPTMQTVDDAKLANSKLVSDDSRAITDTGIDRATKRIKTKEGARRKQFMTGNNQMLLKIAGGTMLTGGLNTTSNAEKQPLEFDNSASPGMEPLPKICQGDSSSGSLDIDGNLLKGQNQVNQSSPMNCKKYANVVKILARDQVNDSPMAKDERQQQKEMAKLRTLRNLRFLQSLSFKK